MAKKEEKTGFRDVVIAILRDKNGKVKQVYDSREHEQEHKTMCNNGFAVVSGLLLASIGGTAFGYNAIGTGTTGAQAIDTALQTEIKRKSASQSRVTTTVSNDTAQWDTTYSSADGLSGTSAVTETGILNAASGGVLLLRQVFAAITCNWDAGDSLEIIVKVQCKQG